MNLYWVETEDHHEDWFVQAPTPIAAELFFEQHEGYGEDWARASFVCALDCPNLEPDWATNELLIQLGAKIHTYHHARVVHLLGKTYTEGLLEGIIEHFNEVRWPTPRACKPHTLTQ